MAGVKGRSGRKPNERLFADVGKQWLAVADQEAPDGTPRTRAWAIVNAMGVKAIDGDVAAFNALADRVEGRPKQAVDLDAKLTARVEGVRISFVDP